MKFNERGGHMTGTQTGSTWSSKPGEDAFIPFVPACRVNETKPSCIYVDSTTFYMLTAELGIGRN